MRYWLLRRPPHYSDINPNAANTPWDYDKVFVNVRLKEGDIVYLIAAYGELYGWGYVIKRESYMDNELQHKAYKATITRTVVRPDLIKADDIKRVPELTELFSNSDLNLIELTATQVNAFNGLIRSQGVVAPADLKISEIEERPKPNHDFRKYHSRPKCRYGSKLYTLD